MSLLALSFVGGVVDYRSIFIQLGLNIQLVDRSYMLITFIQIRLLAGSSQGCLFELTGHLLLYILFGLYKFKSIVYDNFVVIVTFPALSNKYWRLKFHATYVFLYTVL